MIHRLTVANKFRVNWVNKKDHEFTIPQRFEKLTDETTFDSHFGMENCLVHAKDITEFVYYTRKESATGTFHPVFHSFWISNLISATSHSISQFLRHNF